MKSKRMRAWMCWALHGLSRKQGVDYTLYASKLFTQLPRPVLLELGGRATEGVWDGLGGFTDSYNFVFEGNVVVFVTSNIALAAEYKQQPRDYQPIGHSGPEGRRLVDN